MISRVENHKVSLGTQEEYNSNITIVTMPNLDGGLCVVYELNPDGAYGCGSEYQGVRHKELKIHGLMKGIDSKLSLKELGKGIYTINSPEFLAIIDSDIFPSQKKKIRKFLLEQTGACPSCTHFLYEPNTTIHSIYTRD